MNIVDEQQILIVARQLAIITQHNEHNQTIHISMQRLIEFANAVISADRANR